MRLLNYTDGRRQALPGEINTSDDNSPPYAILSHRWGDSEEQIAYRIAARGQHHPSLAAIIGDTGAGKSKLIERLVDRGAQCSRIDSSNEYSSYPGSPLQNRRFNIAVDFGTTYSSIAWAATDDNDIKTDREWPKEQAYIDMANNDIILYIDALDERETHLQLLLKPEHRRKHHPPSRNMFICTCCTERSFSTQNDLDRHKKVVHGQAGRGETRWICPISGPKEWSRHDLFTQHLERMHAPPTRLEAGLDQASRNDMIECATTLLTAFKNLQDAQPQLSNVFSGGISCILNSARPFQQATLTEALWIDQICINDVSRYERSWNENGTPLLKPDVQFVHSIDEMLTAADSIFVEDDEGYICFQHKAMRFFLSNFRIDGVDPSHKTLANICINVLHNQPASESKFNASVGQESDLVLYAYEYWEHHCRESASASLALSVDRIMPEGQDYTTTEEEKRLPDQMEDLHLVDEDDNWLLLRKG